MKSATIVGQGYVGLPLARAASEAGWHVWGLDQSASVVESLNQGLSHVDDVAASDLRAMLEQGYRATTNPVCVSESSVVILCVPTPLGESGSPDLSAVRAACEQVGPRLQADDLVILESTTYPGTTEKVCRPILEQESGLSALEDFHLAYSPERVDPGSKHHGIENTPKLVGGLSPAASSAATSFYSEFVEEVVPLSGPREAEMAKLLENTFRHINIALVNEMAKFCHELGIDIWEAIRGASTKPFGFMKFTPGPGVGGHCIPIDPNYLSYEVRHQLGYPFRFVELAQEINSSMPSYVASRLTEILNQQGKAVNGASILLLGVTYKANVADQREAPSVPLAEILARRGAVLSFHDPFVEQWQVGEATMPRVASLSEAVPEADVVVLLQEHSSYDLDWLVSHSEQFFDTRGVAPEGAHRL